MKIRTLIVDDEPLARAKVRRCLQREADVDIVGEAGSGDRAILAISEMRPDLLFLDVEIPPPNGLQVLRTVREEWLPCTIFTTAHAEHAIEAFELHAIDYLLKPFNERRFATALGRARERLRAGPRGVDARMESLLRKSTLSLEPLERFLVKNNERYVVVPVSEVILAEAAGNYVILHTKCGNQVLRRTLAQLESELDQRIFFRASRSTIVNLNFVREVQVSEVREHSLCLSNGRVVELTRGLREFQARLETPGLSVAAIS